MKLASIFRAVVAISIVLFLVACSGGGGGSSDSGPDGITPAAITGSDQNVKTDSIVTLDGSSSSDPEGKPLTYIWMIIQKPEGSQASLSNPFAVKPTFTPDLDGTYIIALVVSNGSEESSEALITVIAATENSAPVANAGGNKSVGTGALVVLDGTASSDADGDQITYIWSFVSKPDGSTAILSDTAAAKPSFTPDLDGNYVVRLLVNDGTGDSASATVTISATTTNLAPVADAGTDRSVAIGDLVSLDGSSSSDADGDQITYRWAFVSKPEGSAAELSDTAGAKPTFAPDLVGDYVVRLVVNDNTSDSAADTITITAATANVPPVADAGADQSVATESLVTLDGSGSSDLDGDQITYLWSFVSKPEGSATELSDTAATKPTFAPDLVGDYVMRLVVNDGTSDSAADIITITATTANLPPVANAGADKSVATESLVTLDGSGSSDPDGDQITYLWSFVSKPEGSTATLSDTAAAKPTFTSELDGDYVVRLIVNDGIIDSQSATVTITALTISTTSGWQEFKGNSQKTGLSTVDTSANNGTPQWFYSDLKTSLFSGFYSSAAIGANGTIYVGSNDDNFYALNPNGTLKWSYTTDGTVGSSPAIGSNGIIYVGSDDGSLYAFNPDGTLLWSRDLTFMGVESSPTIGSDGTIYVGSDDDGFYAVNPDGTLKWSYTIADGGSVKSSPAIGSDGTIYVGSGGENGSLHAINPDGTLKWKHVTDGGVYTSPAIGSNSTIYFGSNDGNLYAIGPDGTLRWKLAYSEGGWLYSSPAIGPDGTIYIGSDDGNLYAINASGTLKWKYTTGGEVYSSPAIGSDGTIYVGSVDGSIYAINQGGTLEWIYATGGEVESSPAIGLDGTIYVGSADGNLYAIH